MPSPNGSPAPPEPKKPRILQRALLWAAAIAILVWLFVRVPAEDTARALLGIEPITFGLAVVGFSVLTLLLDAFTHYVVFRRFTPPVRPGAVLQARGETYLLLSLGFLYGQGGMAFAMAKRAGKPLGEMIGSLMFLMFNNLLAVMIFPTLALIFLASSAGVGRVLEGPEWSYIKWWLVVSWPICLGLVFFFARDWDNPLRRRLNKGLLTAFHQARLDDYAKIFGLRMLQVLNWCLFSWIAIRAASIAVPFHELLILGPIIALAAVIPTPGRLGTSQGAWVLLFQRQADPAALLAFSLAWTVLVNLLRWLIGAGFVLLGPKAGSGADRAVDGP